MVYWLVPATVQVLLDKLADIGIKAYESMSDVDDKLQKLKRTLISVQSSIHNTEEHYQLDDDMGMEWQILLLDLEKLAYQADDLLDEIAYKVSKLEGGAGQTSKRIKNQVNKLLLSLFKHTSAFNMNNIQVKLDGMLMELKGLCFEREKGMATQLQTTSLLDRSLVFGREIDKTNLVSLLVASDNRYAVSIIPIVGMIGVGKTTLAQLVYNHNYEAPFDLRMWVSITKDFDVVRLTRCIIEAATRESTCHLFNLESLQVRLTEILQGKKYLLILDDLWNEKRNEWNLLLKPLKQGLEGSKIIVTTGSSEVSSLIATAESFHLKCLSDDACQLLLMEEALRGDNLCPIPELKATGMQIAIKCKGLPLAAKIVGNLLRAKVDENDWNNILESDIWNLPVIKNEVVRALKSGYHRLPSHVRQCFAYCSMFPPSYDFEKDKIVRMWMGEGFIMSDNGWKLIEGIGSNYFDQLLQKSFFQMEGKRCMIHEAAHNLAQLVSCEKFLRMKESGDSLINPNTRHLSLVCEDIQTMTFDASSRCKGLRTLLLVGAYRTVIKEVPFDLFVKLGSLRVLDLSGTRIEELAGSIGNLKHLRFLDLSNTLIKLLPETMERLCLLQTLNLRNCLKFLRLPKYTGKLKSLRHLELDGGCQLTSMPCGIGKLTGLQTLSVFIVGPESGQMKELKDLNRIRGSLCIKQLEKVSKPQNALGADLAKKKYIDRLELQWSSTINAQNHEHVIDKLMTYPLESLKEFILKGYGGTKFPKWVCDPSFSKLHSICFYECKNCDLLPALGQLPKLKSLKIVGMHGLVKVDKMFLGNLVPFQSLEILEFRNMSRLERWDGVSDNDIGCLIELTIVNCPQLVILPSLHYFQFLEKLEFEDCPQLPSLSEERLSNSVKSLIFKECTKLKERCKEDGGEDWMKIEHIPYIEIDYVNVVENRKLSGLPP